jgi:hypothetical protein
MSASCPVAERAGEGTGQWGPRSWRPDAPSQARPGCRSVSRKKDSSTPAAAVPTAAAVTAMIRAARADRRYQACQPEGCGTYDDTAAIHTSTLVVFAFVAVLAFLLLLAASARSPSRWSR